MSIWMGELASAYKSVSRASSRNVSSRWSSWSSKSGGGRSIRAKDFKSTEKKLDDWDEAFIKIQEQVKAKKLF